MVVAQMCKYHSFFFRNWQAYNRQVFLKAYVRKLDPFVPRYNTQVSLLFEYQLVNYKLSWIRNVTFKQAFLYFSFNVFKIPYSTEIIQLFVYYSYSLSYRVKKPTFSYRHNSGYKYREDNVSPVITEESVCSFIPIPPDSIIAPNCE